MHPSVFMYGESKKKTGKILKWMELSSSHRTSFTIITHFKHRIWKCRKSWNEKRKSNVLYVTKNCALKIATSKWSQVLLQLCCSFTLCNYDSAYTYLKYNLKYFMNDIVRWHRWWRPLLSKHKTLFECVRWHFCAFNRWQWEICLWKLRGTLSHIFYVEIVRAVRDES